MAAIPESATRFMAGLVECARQRKKTIVFPEGLDPRVREAAARLARDGVVRPVLLGPKPADAPPGVTFLDPVHAAAVDKYAAIYYERRRTKGVTEVEAAGIARNPLYFAALMVGAGDADGSVGGAANTTADTVRAALHCIGPGPRVRLVSSVFFMALQDASQGHNGLMAFADCAVVVDPTPVQLAEIAIASAASTRAVLGTEPVVALLSFSTKGSANHPQVDGIVEALQIVRARAPEIQIDGELQADAVWWPSPKPRVRAWPVAPTRSCFRTSLPRISLTNSLSVWAVPRRSGLTCRGLPGRPTTFPAAARPQTSTTWR